MMRSISLLALLLAAPAPAAAAPWTPDANTCNQLPTTVAIADCLQRQTKLWDTRLNQAYQALTTMLAGPDNATQLADLKRAERAWLQYRKEDCGFYADGQGTIRQIEAADCMRRLTQDRAIELEAAGPQ